MDDDLLLLNDLRVVILTRRSRTDCHVTSNYIRRIYPALSDYPDTEFVNRYHMTKDSIHALRELLLPHLLPLAPRGKYISPEHQLLVAVRFYVTGSFQAMTGDTYAISQASVSRIIVRVSEAIMHRLQSKFVAFPTPETSPVVKAGFCGLAGESTGQQQHLTRPFPEVIGVVGCTYVEVLALNVGNREQYRDRNGNISINVQAICDSKAVFTNVVVRWPGSIEERQIFDNSPVCTALETKQVSGWILGDLCYPCRQYLLTPVREPITLQEHEYNRSHFQTRRIIDTAFQMLKRRFACLGSKMKQDLGNALKTINACFVLHNFLIMRGDNYDILDEDDMDMSRSQSEVFGTGIDSQYGCATRNAIIEQFFS